MTLIDMNGEIGRVDGVAGLTLSSPNIRITAEEAEEVSIEGLQGFADRMKKAGKNPDFLKGKESESMYRKCTQPMWVSDQELNLPWRQQQL